MSKEENCKNVIERLTTKMNDKEKSPVDISTQTGVSNWLTVLPITKFGFELSKQELWDSVRLWHGWEINNLPTSCPWGSTFNIQHSMSCKKVGFITIRRNDLRDRTANITPEVSKDTEIEPKLTALSGEELQSRAQNNSNEARVDIIEVPGNDGNRHFLT